MRSDARTTRRRFLVATTTALASPVFVPAPALGRGTGKPPSERVNIASIGVGGRGSIDTKIFLGSPESQVIAVCDVDSRRRSAARRRVNAYYRAHAGIRGADTCGEHKDFREVLDRRDVDAVMIATPDHWHALISIRAAEAGKDIYCEKPISVCIGEGRVVSDAMRRLGRIYQSGTQRRSVGHFRFSCEIVRNGRIGKLRRIVEYLGAGPTCPPQPPKPIPKGFDYDMWLGPAPWTYYTPRRCHGSFRWLLDTSGGKLTDQGAHFLDIAQWANDAEHTGPLEYEGTGTFPDEGLFNTPVHYNVTCTYANGVELMANHGLINNDWAIRFEGTDGWLLTTRNRLKASRPELLEPLRSDEVPLRKSDHHQTDFLNSVRTRIQPVAPPEIAHRSTTVCHSAVLCLRLGRKLKWNPTEERFIGDDAANRMLTRAKREPWTL